MAGRRVCAWCKKDLGEAPGLADGQVTHGMCADCKRSLDKKLDEAEVEKAKRKVIDPE